MSSAETLHLFQAFGVELEYMIVDAKSLDVRPITDRVLEAVAGEITSDFEAGEITWSNELTGSRHRAENDASRPQSLRPAAPGLSTTACRRINSVLEPMGARLMPSAMHPWMDPHREMVLWPHDNSVDLRGLQSRLRLPRARLGQPAGRPSESSRSPAMPSSPGCTRQSACCCRSCRRWPPVRPSSTDICPG